MVPYPVVILAVSGLSFAGNVPLGCLRARSRPFSGAWLLWTHLSVPFIFLLRRHLGLYPLWVVIPVLVACAVAGQYVGARLRRCRPV